MVNVVTVQQQQSYSYSSAASSTGKSYSADQVYMSVCLSVTFCQYHQHHQRSRCCCCCTNDDIEERACWTAPLNHSDQLLKHQRPTWPQSSKNSLLVVLASSCDSGGSNGHSRLDYRPLSLPLLLTSSEL